MHEYCLLLCAGVADVWHGVGHTIKPQPQQARQGNGCLLNSSQRCTGPGSAHSRYLIEHACWHATHSHGMSVQILQPCNEICGYPNFAHPCVGQLGRQTSCLKNMYPKFTTQYLVLPPFLAKHCSTLVLMLPYRLFSMLLLIACHSFCTVCLNSSNVLQPAASTFCCT